MRFGAEAECLPIGNLHGELGQTVRIRGNYEKQVKVRGATFPPYGLHRPAELGGSQRVSDFGRWGHVGCPYNMHNELEELLRETKNKYAIYLYPSQMEEIKNLMNQANAKSQSEFVSDAIRFYIGYLQQGKNVDYLAPIIAQTIQEEIRNIEKNITQILFKVAVESAILSQIQAFQIQLTPTQMDDLRRMCSQMVAKNNGIITFEDAYAHQHR